MTLRGSKNGNLQNQLSFRDVRIKLSNMWQLKRTQITKYLYSYFHIPNLKSILPPLLFSMLWFFGCSYWNVLSQIFAQNQIVTNGLHESIYTSPLYDIGFSTLPHLNHSDLSDYYLNTLIAIVVLKTLVSLKLADFLVVARRHFFMHGVVFLLRSLSIAVTVLPNPFSHCKPQVYSYANALQVMRGVQKTCFDVLFSGHSAAFMLFSLHWFRNTENQVLKWLIWPFCFGGMLVLIATRYHYTIDVLYGALIALSLYGAYHYLIGDVEGKLKKGATRTEECYGNVGPYYAESSWLVKSLVSFVVWFESWQGLVGEDLESNALEKV